MNPFLRSYIAYFIAALSLLLTGTVISAYAALASAPVIVHASGYAIIGCGLGVALYNVFRVRTEYDKRFETMKKRNEEGFKRAQKMIDDAYKGQNTKSTGEPQ